MPIQTSKRHWMTLSTMVRMFWTIQLPIKRQLTRLIKPSKTLWMTWMVSLLTRANCKKTSIKAIKSRTPMLTRTLIRTNRRHWMTPSSMVKMSWTTRMPIKRRSTTLIKPLRTLWRIWMVRQRIRVNCKKILVRATRPNKMTSIGMLIQTSKSHWMTLSIMVRMFWTTRMLIKRQLTRLIKPSKTLWMTWMVSLLTRANCKKTSIKAIKPRTPMLTRTLIPKIKRL